MNAKSELPRADALARAVAAEVKGWTAVQDSGEDAERVGRTHAAIAIKGKPGARIHLRVDTYRHRLRIFGGYPCADRISFQPFKDGADIHCNPHRPARDIARDICRRFLTVYLAQLEEAFVRMREHVVEVRDARRLARRLATITGGKLYPGSGRDKWRLYLADGVVCVSRAPEKPYVEVELRGVPPEETVALLQAYARGRRARRRAK